MNNVMVRALSGIVYIAVILACILSGNTFFFALTGAFTLLGLYEYHNLEKYRAGRPMPVVVRLVSQVAALSLWLTTAFAADGSSRNALIMFVGFVAAIVVMLCSAVVSKSDKALRTTAASALGIVYIALPLSLLNLVYAWLPGTEGRTLILISLICIWVNDTGAFCVGSRIGRRRLCERLSPKKSWEGFWGGLLLVVVATVIYAAIEEKNAALYIVYGVVVSILSTVGDLFESLLKRTAGVKDSGRLIPGHGGILDRIDSFLFVSYAIVMMGICIYL